jgi:hypothetical protein
MPLDHVHRRYITSIWGRLFLVTDTWPVLVLFSTPSLQVWSACIRKGLKVRKGAKYDGRTNAICWNVDIIANEKLTCHINFCPPPSWAAPWLDKIVPSWKSYGKSKLLRGRSVGTSVSGIGSSKASRSTLANGWCLCNLHRWHIGWWVGAKRCSASRCKAHRTHLIIIIYCKGRKFLPLKLSEVLK